MMEWVIVILIGFALVGFLIEGNREMAPWEIDEHDFGD